MKKLYITLVIAGISFFLIRCSNTDNSKHFERIDSLHSELAGFDSAWQAFNKDTVGSVLEAVTAITDSLGFYLKTIPTRQDINQIMTRYGLMRKSFSKFLSIHDQIGQEINLSAKQLQDLRHDLTEGLLEEKTANQYITDEYDAFYSLKERIERMEGLKEDITYFWDNRLVISDYIDSLKAQ